MQSLDIYWNAELSPGGAGSANRRYGEAVWRLRLSLSLHVLLANVNPTRSYRFARDCASRPQARLRWPYLHSSALCGFHPSVCWQIGMREPSRANLSIVVPLSFVVIAVRGCKRCLPMTMPGSTACSGELDLLLPQCRSWRVALPPRQLDGR